jgi:predicted amidohydrolase
VICQPTPAAVPTCGPLRVQMVSTPRVDENLRTATGLIGEAVAQGAELVALPEYFAIMGMSDDDKVRLREKSMGMDRSRTFLPKVPANTGSG